MSAAAGGVLFLVRGAPAGAHDAPFFAAAFSYSYAAECGVTQASMILREPKTRYRLPRSVVRSQTEILVQFVRFDQLARVHFPVRIPSSFELAEGLHQLRAEHFRPQFGAGLPVSVFSGQRSAITDNKVGRLFHELAIFRNSFL